MSSVSIRLLLLRFLNFVCLVLGLINPDRLLNLLFPLEAYKQSVIQRLSITIQLQIYPNTVLNLLYHFFKLE